MGIAADDRDRTAGISKQTPFKGTKEVERNVPMAFGHGMSVLWPDRRQGIFTGDWGRLCRWEVRASARGGKKRGAVEEEGEWWVPWYSLDLLPPFLGMDPASINSPGSKMMGRGILRFPCLFLFAVVLVCHPSLCLPLCPAGESAVARESPAYCAGYGLGNFKQNPIQYPNTTKISPSRARRISINQSPALFGIYSTTYFRPFFF